MSKEEAKKSSKEQITKQELINQIKSQGIVPLSIAKMAMNNTGKRYAVAHSDGYSVYRRTNAGTFESLESHDWKSIQSATVDNFAIKSVFSFIENGKPTQLIVEDGGKDFANVMSRNLAEPLSVLKRSFGRKILGFRSKTKWKMIIASVVYVTIFFSIIHMFSGGGNSDQKSAAAAPSASTASTQAKQNQVQSADSKKKAKQDLTALVSNMYTDDNQFRAAYNHMTTDMKSGDVQATYDDANSAKTIADNLQYKYSTMNVPSSISGADGSNLQDALQNDIATYYYTDSQGLKNLMDALNSGNMSPADVNKAESNFQDGQSFLTQAVAEITSVASDLGVDISKIKSSGS